MGQFDLGSSVLTRKNENLGPTPQGPFPDLALAEISCSANRALLCMRHERTTRIATDHQPHRRGGAETGRQIPPSETSAASPLSEPRTAGADSF